MQTLALVLAATVLALLIAIPAGILAGFSPKLNAALTPVLDTVQTLPPYIYLLPAIALLGFGPATALIATIIVSIPPALRLTAHGIRMTPTNFVELCQASGISPQQMFLKIRLPFALPNIAPCRRAWSSHRAAPRRTMPSWPRRDAIAGASS